MRDLCFFSGRGLRALCFVSVSALLFFAGILRGQSVSRINYAGKGVFLNGINIAWVNFAGDLGPAPVSVAAFRNIFQQVRDSGGNSLRLWLHTNGMNSPSYNSQGYVTGPGPVAIRNLKEILGLAYKYRVGLVLCLWSFDMLGKHEGLDSALLYANQKMLMDTAFTMAYIRNALIPMVDSVKGDSAVIAWEVCNEANGMTTGMNFYAGDPTVPASAVQRFTNLLAGAIHRADPSALVTTGPGSFNTLTDVNPVASAEKGQLETVSSLQHDQLKEITKSFNRAHRLDLTTEEMYDYLMRVAQIPDSNIYRDDRLIAAGGDSLGTLDFYSVHYYYYGSSALSPFMHQFSYWGLTKPTVVAEFYMQNTDGMPDGNLYPSLYVNGYAGALAWSWTDFPNTPNNPASAATDTWAALKNLWSYYKSDVDVFGAEWPSVSITYPPNNSIFTDSTQLTITAQVVDTGSVITSVQFFQSDTLLGTVVVPDSSLADTSLFSLRWKNIPAGAYLLQVIATNATGQEEVSSPVKVQIGLPAMTNLEAEDASFAGAGISVKGDPLASGGKYLAIETNDMNATVTWRFVNHASAGNYSVVFGFKDPFSSTKTQFINVNGARADTVTFPMTSSWSQMALTVPLVQDTNIVQVQMWWGWMYLDYLGVPSEILTSIAMHHEPSVGFALQQNYPNPFNPATTISYRLSAFGRVSLKVYDVLGREVTTLVDAVEKPGTHEVRFDASRFASGMYFYRLTAGGHSEVRKLLLLK